MIFCSLFFILHVFISAESMQTQTTGMLTEEQQPRDANNGQASNHEKFTSFFSHTKDFYIYFLSSIVYFDDKHWTIWLNDEEILPQQIDHLNVDLVVHKMAIDIKRKGSEDPFFELRPNQTICLKSKKICSGDAREKLKQEEIERVDGEDFDFG